MAHKSYSIDLDDREFLRKLQNLTEMTARTEQMIQQHLKIKAAIELPRNPFGGFQFPPTAFKLPEINTQKSSEAVEELKEKVSDAKEHLNELTESLEDSTEANRASATSFDQLSGVLAKFLTAGAVAGFVNKLVSVRGEFQQLEIAFGTMLKSADKAQGLITQLADTAAKTPFDLQGVTQGAKQLLAYGVAAEDINDKLLMLGDIASGLSLPLGDLVYLYGTTMTQGRVYTRDMIQFMGRGIPLAEELAKQFGVTKDKVSELVSAGKVGAKEFEQAMQSMRTNRFNNLMEEQSKSLTGQISNIEDAIQIMYDEIGKSSEGMLNKGLQGVSFLVEHYKEVGKALGTLIITYGSARAAVVACSIAMGIHQKGLVSYIASTKIATKVQAIFNATVKSNPIVALVGAVIGLVAAYAILRDRTSDVEKAQKWLNEANEKAKADAEEAKEKAMAAVQTMKNESSTLLEVYDARKLLNSLFPEIFKNMTDEEIKLMSLIDLERILKKAKEDRGVASMKADLAELREEEKAAKKALEDAKNTPAVSGFSYSASIEYESKKLEGIQAKIRAAEADIAKEERKQNLARMTTADKRALQEKEVNRLLQEREKLVAETTLKGYTDFMDVDKMQKLDRSIKTAKETLAGFDKEVKKATFSGEVDSARARVKGLEEDLRKLRRGDWKLEEGQTFASLIEEKTKELNSAKSALNGLLGTSTTGDSKAKKLTEEAARLRKSFEESVHKQVESGADSLRQSAISGLSGMELIEAQYQIALDNIEKSKQEYITKHKATQEQANALFYDLEVQAEEKRTQDKDKYYQSLLEKYATYEQQRRAAMEEAEKEIAVLRERGDEGNVKEAEEKEKTTLEAIDLQFAMRSDEFQEWLDKVADMSLDALIQKLAEAQAALEVLETGSDVSPEELAVKRAEVAKLIEMVKKAKREANKGGTSRSFKDWQDLHKTLTDLTAGFDKLGQSVGGTLGSIIQEAGGLSTSVIGMIDGIMTFANTSVKGVKTATTGTQKALKTLEAGTVILSIISSAISIMQRVAKWFSKNTELSEEQKRAYQSLINSTRELARANMELMRSLSPDKVGEAYKKTLALLKQGQKETYEMMSKWMSSGAKDGFLGIGAKSSHGFYVVDRLKEEAELLKKTLGRDIFQGEHNGFLFASSFNAFENLKKLSIEEIEKLKQSPKLWGALGKEMQDYYSNILEMQKQIADAEKKRKDAITGTSLDAVTSDALEWISNLDDAMKSPAETFEKTMQNAIKRIIKNKYLVKEMQKWYDDFAKAGEDGAYTETEIEALRQSYYSTTEAVRKKYEAMAKAIGSDALSTEDSRHAEAKGIAQASQESVDENNALLNLQVQMVDKLSKNFDAYSATLLSLQTKGWQEVRAIRSLTEQVESHTRSIDTNIKDVVTNGLTMK
ncbi:tape measure protein [uncultured Porphyromonas sp.]|jgi:tape measure domain-containing protein|uniref:tape measure protein n=1 Tax=uncultured Porphyromonas sp. TaxID=159274 RepID=UPI0027DE587C|nr:tape measure protein [uncultured Porphyromonas sp.]